MREIREKAKEILRLIDKKIEENEREIERLKREKEALITLKRSIRLKVYAPRPVVVRGETKRVVLEKVSGVGEWKRPSEIVREFYEDFRRVSADPSRSVPIILSRLAKEGLIEWRIIDGVKHYKCKDVGGSEVQGEPDFVDRDGYPTERAFVRLRELASDSSRAAELVEFLKEVWWQSDWGVVFEDSDGEWELELHTAGWSGNEELISELKRTLFWACYWRSAKVGGHYYFSNRSLIEEQESQEQNREEGGN